MAETRPQCPRLIWMHGTERPCGMEIGLRSWTDHTGIKRYGCRAHDRELRYRYPEAVAEPPMPVFLHEDPDFVDHDPDATYWTEGVATK